jgi:hypothetical protein
MCPAGRAASEVARALLVCNQETREAMYRALVEGGYKGRPGNGKEDYLEVNQVFVSCSSAVSNETTPGQRDDTGMFPAPPSST